MVDPVFSLDSLFKIAEIVALLGGGWMLARKQGEASKAVSSSTAVFEQVIKDQGERHNEAMRQVSERIKGVEEEIKGLSRVVTEVAVQNQRLDTQDRRLDSHDRKIEELSRGEGYVLPIAEALKGRGRGPA